MLRSRLALAAVALCSLALFPGCLTLFSKTEVVRGDESRKPVRFESQQAAEEFNSAVKWKSKSLGGSHLGIPFVTFYEKDRQLSASAHFNDCVTRCDTDQDGVITLAEAKIFAKVGE
jgi:hypothetical protein